LFFSHFDGTELSLGKSFRSYKFKLLDTFLVKAEGYTRMDKKDLLVILLRP